MADAIKCLITHAADQLNTIIETISVIQHEMLTLASQLPVYPIVMRMFGVDPVLGPQLMAHITALSHELGAERLASTAHRHGHRIFRELLCQTVHLRAQKFRRLGGGIELVNGLSD